MKCDAAAIRRSACVGAAERVEREDLDRRVAVARAASRSACEPRRRVAASSAASRSRRARACSPPPAPRWNAAACSSARARLGGPAERAQHAPEVDAAERGQPDVAGRLGLGDAERERRGARLVVAGLALGAAEAGRLVGLGLGEAEPAGRLGGAGDVLDGVVEAALEPRQLAEHRVAADVHPRVVDLRSQRSTSSRARAARAASPAEIAARAANSAFAAWSQGSSRPRARARSVSASACSQSPWWETT